MTDPEISDYDIVQEIEQYQLQQKESIVSRIIEGLANRVENTLGRITKKKITMIRSTEIRVLTLNDNENLDSTIFRLEKNWILQFRLGPSLYGRKVHVYTNYPIADDGKHEDDFIRNQYRSLQWHQDEGCKYSDDTSAYCEIEVKKAGSFHFYFIYDKT